MRDKIIYINEKLIHVIEDAQKLALSFCDGMNADIFGKTKIKRSEYERRVYGAINALSSLQSSLTDVNDLTVRLKSDVLREIEELYRSDQDDIAEKLSTFIAEIENTQNVCFAISEDCISEYIKLLDTSLSSVSESKETVISVSELKSYARALFLRSEEYLRKIKQ